MPEFHGTSEYRLLSPALLTRLGRLELIARQAVTGMLQAGVHRSRSLGAGQEFEQYRRYSPGDDLRQVDWRLFARSDQLHCRLQTPDTAARLAIVLDASASMNYQGDQVPCSKLRCACVIAACMAYLAERQGDRMALLTYGGSLPSETARTMSFQEMCRTLENLTASGDAHADNALSSACDFVRGRGLVVWITDFLGEESTLERTLRAFQTAGKACYAFQVLDPTEISFDLQGARRFHDPEGSREITADPQRVRDEYRRRMDAFLTVVREACLRQGVSLTQVTALDDIGDILFRLLE